MQAGPVADAFTRYKGGAAWDVLEYDDDPIVRAMWLPVEVALKERNFANQRKTILQPALNLFNSQNILQQKAPPTPPQTPKETLDIPQYTTRREMIHLKGTLQRQKLGPANRSLGNEQTPLRDEQAVVLNEQALLQGLKP